jgi:hypothetical protein
MTDLSQFLSRFALGQNRWTDKLDPLYNKCIPVEKDGKTYKKIAVDHNNERSLVDGIQLSRVRRAGVTGESPRANDGRVLHEDGCEIHIVLQMARVRRYGTLGEMFNQTQTIVLP